MQLFILSIFVCWFENDLFCFAPLLFLKLIQGTHSAPIILTDLYSFLLILLISTCRSSLPCLSMTVFFKNRKETKKKVRSIELLREHSMNSSSFEVPRLSPFFCLIPLHSHGISFFLQFPFLYLFD